MFEIIEAAYELETTHRQWRRRLTDQIRAYWGRAASYTYEALPAYDLSVFESSELERGHATQRVVDGVMRKINGSRRPGLVIDVLEGVVEVSPCDLVVLRVPEAALQALDDPEEPDHEVARPGVCIALPARSMTARELETWSQLAYHIKNAFRLRTALADAGGDNGREMLRTTAQLVTRARREVESEAASIWEELVSGRWSLVDRFDADGREYLIAHRNDDGVRDLRALSGREVAVAKHLAHGRSNRLIGEELGLSPSVVSDAIGSMARKLGVDSRVALVGLLGALDIGSRAS